MVPAGIDPGGAALWFNEGAVNTGAVNVVRDVGTGAFIRRLPNGKLISDATKTVVECVAAPDDRRKSDFVIRDGTTGAERRRFPIPSGECGSAVLDLSERYLIMTDFAQGDTFALNHLVDLASGEVFSFQALSSLSVSGYFVRPTARGPEIDFATSDGILRFKPATPTSDPNQFRDPRHDTVFGANGQIALNYYTDRAAKWARIELTRLAPQQRRLSGASLGHGPGELGLGVGDVSFDMTPDGRRMLAIGDTDELRVYATSDLSLVRTIPLPVPNELGALDHRDGKNVMIIDDDEVAVFYAGMKHATVGLPKSWSPRRGTSRSGMCTTAPRFGLGEPRTCRAHRLSTIRRICRRSTSRRDGISTVDLDRKNVLRRLCAIADRDYTEAERDQLAGRRRHRTAVPRLSQATESSRSRTRARASCT